MSVECFRLLWDLGLPDKVERWKDYEFGVLKRWLYEEQQVKEESAINTLLS